MTVKQLFTWVLFVPYSILFSPFYLGGFLYNCSKEAFKIGIRISQSLLENLNEIVSNNEKDTNSR